MFLFFIFAIVDLSGVEFSDFSWAVFNVCIHLFGECIPFLFMIYNHHRIFKKELENILAKR